MPSPSLSFSRVLLPVLLLLCLLSLQLSGALCSRISGDPVFVGFLGQVYQVHGLAGEIFNLLTSPSMQLNALFSFIGEGQAMSAGQQQQAQLASAAASPRTPLPLTAAWSHPGTYLGAMGLQVGEHTLLVTPGPYATGFASIHLDGRAITKSGWLLRNTPLTAAPTLPLLDVRIIGWHRIAIRTAEVSFHLVNSDGFFNLDNAELRYQPSPLHPLDGVLGQSADPTRYFPDYQPTAGASSDVKSDFQRHMIYDFLVLDGDLTSTEFQANLFGTQAEAVEEVKAEGEKVAGEELVEAAVSSE